jgi:hypothetical protein
MAKEREGDAYEALTYIALRNLGLDIHWDISVKGFSINPDFVIGDIKSPTHWILVTSTGVAKNSVEKFWRNTGEIFEVKKNFDPPPKIINLVFENKQRGSTIKAMSSLSDIDFSVEKRDYGEILINFIERIVPNLPKEKVEKSLFIEQELLKNKSMSDAFEQFQKDLKSAFNESNNSTSLLWRLSRLYKGAPKTREIKQTFIRRGIAKLILISHDIRQEIYQHIYDKRVLNGSYPSYLYTLELLKRTVTGSKLIDHELVSIFKLLSQSEIEYVVQESPVNSMMRWIQPLQNLNNTNEFLRYVEENFSELSTSAGMRCHLERLYINPYDGLNQSEIGGEISIVWLFFFLIDLAKSYSGKSQDFGMGELTKQAVPKIQSGRFPANHTVWRLDLPNYFNRSPQSSLPDEVLNACSEVLASLLSNKLKKSGVIKAGNRILKMTITSNLEQKLIPYWLFQPLPTLLEYRLNQKDIAYEKISAHQSFVGEYVGNTRANTTPIIKTGKTLIHWKSSHDSHTNDKSKELAGRVQSLKFKFNKTFELRDEIKKFILIIDGTFTERNVQSLYAAGWDEIFYGDELNILLESII